MMSISEDSFRKSKHTTAITSQGQGTLSGTHKTEGAMSGLGAASGGSMMGGMLGTNHHSDDDVQPYNEADVPKEGHFLLSNPTLLLELCVAEGISDIHLRVGQPPVVRKNGRLMYTKLPRVNHIMMDSFVNFMLPEDVRNHLVQITDYDFPYELPGLARFRCNFLREMGQVGFAIRVIRKRIPSLDELGLPPAVGQFVHENKGLIIVTGPTGSGKSTTLASILNTINSTYSSHIVTLEDPIEYQFEPRKSLVTQRQVGLDTDSYVHGLKYLLRQDPDVILIGEMRDRETVQAALHAAETGHLVFSTLHTIDAVQTINRIINLFEPHERDAVRVQLASILVGTVSQRLALKRDNQGRIAVGEIMMVSPTVRDFIYKNQIESIYEIVNSSEFEGSCSLNVSLYMATLNEYITQEEAMKLSVNRPELQMMFRGSNQRNIVSG
ncbi:MAG: type IV pilus twitching motility protein PilT [Vampirovibrionales bacterium]